MKYDPKKTLREVQLDYIKAALEFHDYRIGRVYRELGVTAKTIYNILHKEKLFDEVMRKQRMAKFKIPDKFHRQTVGTVEVPPITHEQVSAAIVALDGKEARNTSECELPIGFTPKDLFLRK